MSAELKTPLNFQSLWGVAILLVLTAVPFVPLVNAPKDGDVQLYEDIAKTAAAGMIPYRDRELEYPPYAIAIFSVPRLLSQWATSGGYQFFFALFVIFADAGVKCLLLSAGLKSKEAFRSLLPFAAYCLCIPFMSFFYLQRYDIFPALLTIASLHCFATGRYGFCGALLAIGGGVKLYPL